MSQITKIPNMILFIAKRLCEGPDNKSMPAQQILDELKIEYDKKDGFPTDFEYKAKVWRVFYKRGIIMNILLFIVLTIIFSYATIRTVLTVILVLIKKLLNFLRKLYFRIIGVKKQEESTGEGALGGETL